jgi:hypothetical protein
MRRYVPVRVGARPAGLGLGTTAHPHGATAHAAHRRHLASREDREAWHHDPAFLERRPALEQLEEEPSRTEWFEVVADARRD